MNLNQGYRYLQYLVNIRICVMQLFKAIVTSYHRVWGGLTDQWTLHKESSYSDICFYCNYNFVCCLSTDIHQFINCVSNKNVIPPYKYHWYSVKTLKMCLFWLVFWWWRGVLHDQLMVTMNGKCSNYQC